MVVNNNNNNSIITINISFTTSNNKEENYYSTICIYVFTHQIKHIILIMLPTTLLQFYNQL